jgi:ribose 5-phosphate isomerase B
VRIVITADHNGVALKERVVAWLREHCHAVEDRAPHVGDGVVDYPPLCADVCRQVLDGAADRAIVIGGSGQGEAIACNKIHGIRAGLCQDLFSTRVSRGNNDSNVLVIGAKVVEPALAEQIVETWLATPFNGGVHQRRLDQIAAIERSSAGTGSDPEPARSGGSPPGRP